MRRLRSILVTAVTLATSASLLAATGPSYAGPPPPATGWYLALGDSVAAGYQPGTGADLEGGYADNVLDHLRDDEKTQLRNLACPGETSAGLVGGGGPCAYEEGSQLDQALVFLRAHDDQVRLVTISIGANDVTPCLGRPAAEIQACVGQRLQQVAANLGATIDAVHAAAPDAQVVVTEYHNPFIVVGALAELSATFHAVLLQVLNQVALAHDAEVAGVAAAFLSYPTWGSLSVAQATICATTWMCSVGDIHPNDAGYDLYADAVIAEL